MVDPHDRRHCETRSKVGQTRRPGGRNLVGDHDQRTAGVLRLIPGVEQLFLIALFGFIEEPPSDPLDEAARKERAS